MKTVNIKHVSVFICMHYITSNYFSDKEYLLKVDGSWMQRVVDGQVVDIDINMSDV